MTLNNKYDFCGGDRDKQLFSSSHIDSTGFLWPTKVGHTGMALKKMVAGSTSSVFLWRRRIVIVN